MVGLAVLAVGIRYNPLVLVALKAAADFLCTFINAWPNKRLLNYSIIEQWKDIIPSVAVSILWPQLSWLREICSWGWLGLGMQILFGAVVYMLASWVLGLEVFRYIRGLVVTQAARKKVNRMGTVRNQSIRMRDNKWRVSRRSEKMRTVVVTAIGSFSADIVIKKCRENGIRDHRLRRVSR